MKNRIGLDTEKSKLLAERTNELLANYQLFYINTRNFYWNITGEKFFELHLKFEELYTDALLKVDEIAERIRTLDHTPLHSFTDYLNHTTICEVTGTTNEKKAMEGAVSGFQTQLDKERNVLKLAEDAGHERPLAMMGDYTSQQEKLVWIYSAYLKFEI